MQRAAVDGMSGGGASVVLLSMVRRNSRQGGSRHQITVNALDNLGHAHTRQRKRDAQAQYLAESPHEPSMVATLVANNSPPRNLT